jgi:hemoglobin
MVNSTAYHLSVIVESLMNRKIYVPPGGPPQVPPPSKEIYAHMGQDNIFKMLEDFYLELEASAIRSIFPDDMVAASKKSAAFFVGLLGGPPLYHRQYGSPMLRARHLPFPIDGAARQEWLACFDHILDQAVEKYNFPAQHLEGFRAFLHGFSTWMVNTA